MNRVVLRKPGGLADEKLGRLLSEDCHSFQVEDGLHLFMYSKSSLFFSAEGLQ